MNSIWDNFMGGQNPHQRVWWNFPIVIHTNSKSLLRYSQNNQAGMSQSLFPEFSL